MKSLEGRVAVVTGAGRGIGRAIALTLAREGAKLALGDLDAGSVEKVAREVAERESEALPVQADLRREEDANRLIDTAVERFGRLDLLVNNAGVWVIKPFVEMTNEDWELQLNTNLRAIFYLCRRAIPALTASGQGNIVNIASMAAIRFTVPHIPYAATKAGVVALTRDLAVELGPQRIRVNAVAPGPIDSAGRTKALPPEQRAEAGRRYLLGRIGEPEDIAEAVAFLASDRASYITGATIPVTGGAELRIPSVM
jgi:NAD(P)-dependent dehydrogenase (short-subunit alcohol dehydrogenase family)